MRKPVQKETESNFHYLQRLLNWERHMTEQQFEQLMKEDLQKINDLQQQVDVMNIKLSKTIKECDAMTENLQAFITLLNENNRLIRQNDEKKTDTTTS
tara:strand:- start:346 stop:639 length:294 start_codon:yes stop_codon:yes gene_type:complete